MHGLGMEDSTAVSQQKKKIDAWSVVWSANKNWGFFRGCQVICETSKKKKMKTTDLFCL